MIEQLLLALAGSSVAVRRRRPAMLPAVGRYVGR